MNALTIIAICIVAIIALYGYLFWWDNYSYPCCPECRDNSSSSRISRQMSVCRKHKLVFSDPPKNRAIGSAAPISSRQLFLE